jgi:hypothetical protein
VNDPEHKKPQHIKAEEAKQLNGHNKGSTAGRDVTKKMRLEAIGRDWDINTVNIILSRSAICSGHLVLTANATQAIVDMYNSMEPDALSECLMELDPDTRDWYMMLLTDHIANSAQAELLAGSEPGDSNAEAEGHVASKEHA